MTVSWCRYFFKKSIRANLVAAVATEFHEAYIDHFHYKNECIDWPEDVDFSLYYKVAHDAFIDMGADLKKHPLKLTALNSKAKNGNTHEISTVHQDILDGSYHLKLNPYYYDGISKHINNPNIDNKGVIHTICAHEATHAIEKHDMINIYSSILATYTTVQFFNAFQVPLLLTLALQTAIFLSTSAYIGRKMELRADRQAALNPLVRDNLIAIFLAELQQQHREIPTASLMCYLLWEHHPSFLERKQALEEGLSKSSSSPGLD